MGWIPYFKNMDLSYAIPIDLKKGIYVGRFQHEGTFLPAKVTLNGVSVTLDDGEEHERDDCEVLVGLNYAWVSPKNGGIPEGAVVIGENIVKRVDCWQVGKVREGVDLYIPSDGEELPPYEVLVSQQLVEDESIIWQKTNVLATPINAVISGYDQHGNTIYVARAEHNGIMLPATFIPAENVAFVAHNRLEIRKEDIEVLMDNNKYEWLKKEEEALLGKLAMGLVCSFISEIGKRFPIGRGSHEGNLRPGLWSFDDQCVLIPYGGEEITVEDFEILVRKI